MEEGFRLWANPSSPHAEGRKAREALEDARARVKAALGWDGEVIFTSGASEAAALALSSDALNFGPATEHDAIYQSQDYFLPTLPNGQVDLESFDPWVMNAQPEEASFAKRALVMVQHVNSETGNRQDVDAVASKTRERGGFFLSDCAQSAGKFSLPPCDMAIISAHKFGGPIGVGALLVRDYAMLSPSGGQERGYRRGTENLPGVLGMAAALEASASPYVDPQVLEPLDALAEECRNLGGTWLSDRLSDPTPYIRAVSMPGMSASAQVMRFDMAGISVSQGSACSSGTMKVSRVLEAMQIEPEIAANTIRISVGWNSTRAETERFCEVWLDMARQ